MTNRLPRLALWLAAVALAIPAAALLFSTFMLYDDEGYVLFSYKTFAEHGRLYTDVYTQYGPFPYALYFCLHLLGMPFTHLSGRAIVLLEWVAASGLCAGTVWRLTGKFGLSLLTLVTTYTLLWVMIAEPNHPGGLIALITTIMAFVGSTGFAAERRTRTLVILGVCCAALFLTKINIGVFACTSLFVILLINQPASLSQRWAAPICAGLLVALPFGLMKSLLGTPWVTEYALLAALAGISCVAALARSQPIGIRLSGWLAAAGGALAIGVASCLVVMAKGTKPADLIEGVILGPIKHPGRFSIEFHWPVSALILAVLSCLGAIAALLFSRRGERERRITARFVAALRVVAFAGLLVCFFGYPDNFPERNLFPFLACVLWLFAWPLAEEPSPESVGRQWVTLLLAGQWLHAYPVPGSQIAWGIVLIVPLAAASLAEAIPILVENASGDRELLRHRANGCALLVCLAFSGYLAFSFSILSSRYRGGRSLQLPGAEAIRLPAVTETALEILCLNAEAHADTLFSMPGMYSFNLWTGLPTPTYANATHWFSLLETPQQDAIIAALQASPRACIIVAKDNLTFLHENHVAVGGPLKTYIDQNFSTVFEIDGFLFQARNGRTVFPFGFFEVFHNPTDKTSLVKLRMLVLPGHRLTQVKVGSMNGLPGDAFTISRENSRVEITPVNTAGKPAGPTRAGVMPIEVGGASIVNIYVNGQVPAPSPTSTLLTATDENGAEIASLRAMR